MGDAQPGLLKRSTRSAGEENTLIPPPRRRTAEDQPGDLVLALEAETLLRVLLACIAVLVVSGTLAAAIMYGFDADRLGVLLKVVMLDSEANLPTFFSCGLLLLNTALLAMIAVQERRWRGRWRMHWAFLALLFALLAFDEAATLHERLIEPVRNATRAGGLLFFAWIVPGFVFVAALAVAYLRFLLALPRPFPWLFLLAAALFLGGSLGMEMPGGAYAEAYGKTNFVYHALATVEETLEMTGAAVFAYALTRLLAVRGQGVRLTFRGSRATPGAARPGTA